MDFQILGPVVVFDAAGEVIDLGGPVRRTLLTALLMRANRTVLTDTLVEEMWDGRPPRTAATTVHTHLSRLRSRLAAAGPDGADRIVRDAAGYRLRVEPDELDADRFTDLLCQARTAPADAVAHYDRALRMWRAPAMVDIEAAFARPQAAVLDEYRIAAVEEHAALRIDAGDQAGAAADLRVAASGYPLRERVVELLMLALQRDGRTADALAAYQAFRSRVAADLGLEPSLDLRELHHSLLCGTVSGGLTGRRSLPPDCGDVSGRRSEIHALLDTRAVGNGPPVQVITGQSGSGKTALAVHVAHRLADRYPDGQLYLSLTQDHRPVPPADAARTLLLMLGVPASSIPDSLELRVAVWRTQLAHSRTLVLLDDAASAEQVAALLPAGRGCLVLVTSRDRLAELPAVRRVSLRGAVRLAG
ncbi:MAG TPA: AfsR/SARP family transcriptional regulator [Actinokineospora sp.]|nr:AfsR/SARP family transcriptional regulator [Actinokineospora sp.]